MKIIKRFIIMLSLFLLIALGIYFVIPNLKPNNNAFKPQTPSHTVSPRLKGIFKGMGDGFSNEEGTFDLF